ncbi:MAG: hypothetical protein JEY71_16555 [Sphaerochaeta sp.]|nr:hypothetical protein [Sphaerochaeta sp.]
MYNLSEIKKTCSRFSQAYDHLRDAIYTWARSKAPLRRNISWMFMSNYGPDLPEEYSEIQVQLFVASHALTNPKAIKRILRNVGSEASANEKEVLSFWVDNPAFWCFYAIRETLEDEFFIIEDLLTGQTHLFHSHDVAYMQKQALSRNKHYLSLMAANGSCLQPIGFSKYNSLSASDMQFYLSLSAPGLDLTSAINKNFWPIITLDSIRAIPVIVEGDIELKRTWQPFKLETFAIEDLPGTWVLKDRKAQQRFTFATTDAAMRGLPNYKTLKATHTGLKAILVREKSSGAMALITNSDASYSLFSAMLNRSFAELALPEKPSVSISLALTSLLDEGDHPVPWKKYLTILAFQKEPAEETIPTMAEMLDMQDPSKPFDIRTLYSKQ